MKISYYVLIDAIVRIAGCFLFYSLFFNLGNQLGSEYRGFQVLGFLFISIFSCLIENILIWVGVFFFKNKYYEKTYWLVSIVISLIFSFLYFYLFFLESKSDEKLKECLFLILVMSCGTVFRMLLEAKKSSKNNHKE